MATGFVHRPGGPPLSLLLPVILSLGLTVQSPSRSVGAISGPPEVQTILARMRAALGGEERLGAVRTLLIKGSNTFFNAQGRPTDAYPFTYRVLLPDSFERTLDDLKVSFSVVGRRSWRQPPLPENIHSSSYPSEVEYFAEVCLLMLARSPSQMHMAASLGRPPSPGTTRLVISGDVRWTLDLDAEGRPHVLEYTVDMYAPGANVPMPTTKRLTVEKWARSAALMYPAAMSTAYLPRARAMLTEFSDVRVNEGVSRRDFEAPKGKSSR